jgi:predicted XRE-type DNA-binding protein
MAGVEVAQSLPDRLRAAQEAVRDANGALRLRLRHRRELILEAIDSEGMTQQEVARIVGVAKGRISAILASPDDDDD